MTRWSRGRQRSSSSDCSAPLAAPEHLLELGHIARSLDLLAWAPHGPAPGHCGHCLVVLWFCWLILPLSLPLPLMLLLLPLLVVLLARLVTERPWM